MQHAITKLLLVAGEPILDSIPGTEVLKKWGALGKELVEMIHIKNGFYAFESALLVRPLHNMQAPLGLLEWNAPELWRGEYETIGTDSLFFAEDAFGGQYCIHENRICAFDPETGLFDVISDSLSTWANDVMANFEIRTGYPLVHNWQTEHGPLPAGMRLLPKIPFVCGGKYEVENLYAAVDLKGMIFRASIANQIRDLPDGTKIVFKIMPDALPVEKRDV